uniref:Uncharacterized protein n=2 Tax=Opuntia streptacantha TaxID=393608 RepID=A0A7C9CLM8_OPUST
MQVPLQQIMGPLHVKPTDILTHNLDNLRTPPPLMNAIDNPLRNPRLPEHHLPLHPNPNRRQSPNLRPRQCQLRQSWRLPLLLLLLLDLAPLSLNHPPKFMEPHSRIPCTRVRNRVLGTGPARVKCMPDAVIWDLAGIRDENLPNFRQLGIAFLCLGFFGKA